MSKEAVWKWITYNRFTVIVPLITCLIWVTAIGCTPEVKSPKTGKMVTAIQLDTEYQVYLLEYENAIADLQRQVEMQNKIQELILSAASGGITSWGSLANLLVTGGFIGFLGDNIRKRTVISTLKRT